MPTVYERVDALEQAMTTVQQDIENLTNGMPDANDLLARATTDLSNENLNEWIGEKCACGRSARHFTGRMPTDI